MTLYKQFQNITVNIWINLQTKENIDIVKASDVFEIGYTNDGYGIYATITDSASNTFMVESRTEIPTNEWTMLSIVYDQSSLTLYKNGRFAGSVSCNGNPCYDNSSTVRIGPFDAYAQEFRLYDSAYSQSKIKDLYDVVNDKDGVLISSSKEL